MGLMKKVFGSDNDRNIAKLEKIAKLIEDKADYYKAMSDTDLKNMTVVLKDRLAKGETLNDVLPDAYAVVREASTRVLGMRHFHVQLLGGIALFQGRIAEMKTGEGKTLVVTLPAYLQALEGKGVHIVTVNEFLVTYQSKWMSKVFNFLGMTVGVTLSANTMSIDDKRNAYKCDITYGTNHEFGFDYLRDNLVRTKEERIARGYNFAIVDEVDSILIDEARTPLIISGQGMKSNDTYVTASKFSKSLKAEDYEIDEKDKQIRLTEEGVAKAERYFKLENLSDLDNIELNHHINNALRAEYIMKVDNDYIVSDGEIIIVDQFTGRLMEGRKYSAGLHQAIEAKEGVEIRDEDKTIATITFQNFFRMYTKLSGMTGTAKTEEMEFNKIYYLDVVQIPTNMPVLRKDFPDIVYKTEAAKFAAIVKEVQDIHKTGRPILIGTVTIEKSEALSRELSKNNISHFVLNAKNHQQESLIVAQAGRLGNVTIATNMAGRGTDILLGGNPEFLAKQKLKEIGYNDTQIDFAASLLETENEELMEIRKKYHKLHDEYKVLTDKEKQQVVEFGGLHIVGTERHESRRIDNQLRGRSGRQGDPGSSVFYVSMEDELLRRFGGETMQKFMNFMHMADDIPLQYKMLSRRIEGAQKRIEGQNFSMRHSVLRFDDVLNKQRELIYAERNKVIDGQNVHEEIVDMIRELAENVVFEKISDEKLYDEWDLEELNKSLNGRIFLPDENFVTEKMVHGLDAEELAVIVSDEAARRYEDKMEEYKKLGLRTDFIEGMYLLRVVDTNWMSHIDYMDMLRKEIVLRQYGNHDPIVAYKQEGFEVFDQMVERIREEVATLLINLRIEVKIEQAPQVVQQAEQKILPKNDDIKMATNNPAGAKSSAQSNKLIGRNAACHCGSGKKYKNCHGKNA